METMLHRVKTLYTATHLDAPEIGEASNLTEVLLWLDKHLDGYEWHQRHVRKGGRNAGLVLSKEIRR